MNEKQRKIVWLAAVAVFVIFCVAVGYFIGVPMVRLAEDPDAFRLWVDSYGVWGRLLFVGMVVVQVIIAFIPGEPIEMAAGYAFGFWEGSLLTLTGFLIGSWLIFLLVRKLGSKLVEVFFERNRIEELKFLQNPKKTKVIAFILMLIPGTPKDFLSYFAGMTQLTLRQWLVIVAIGRIPSLVTSTATGAAAGQKNYALTVTMLAVTVVVSVAGIIYYRLLCKQQQEEETKKTEEA